MLSTLIILVVTVVMFAIGKVRGDIVALCALIALLLAGVLRPQEALAGFSSPIVIMMAGLFIVSGGVVQTGLAKKLSGALLRLSVGSEMRMFLLVMLGSAGIGAFVSNTGTVALMLPIVVSMAASANVSARRLLMPLAFGSSMGGMLTLIGTPPNLVIDEVLQEAGHEGLSFFSFLPVGAVCLGVGIVVLLPLSKWLLGGKKNAKDGKPKNKSLRQLVKEYGLADDVTRCTVPEGASIVGKSIGELAIRQRYGLTVMEVRREQKSRGPLMRAVEQSMATPETVLEAGDIVYLSGPEEAVRQLSEDYGLTLSTDAGEMAFYDIGLAEVVLLRRSKFVGALLREAGFREKYGINILAVRRDGRYIKDDLHELRLLVGDVLLVQGTWVDIGRMSSDEEHWVVLGQPLEEASRVTLDYKAPLAGAIMMAMVAMMVFDFIPVQPVTAVLIASLLMILTGCFRSIEAAYKTINWESIILIAAMMPMAVALEKTGVSAWVSSTLVDSVGTAGPMVLLAGIYFTTSLMTMFVSNTATAVLMAPIALQTATSLGISPLPLLFGVAVAASMCFASPFATPPNALVMRAGRYTFADYVRVGLPLQLIMGIVMVVVLPLLFPFAG